MLETGADVGLAFDGDADRVFLVDEQGAAGVGLDDHGHGGRGDARQAARARRILHNLICSKAVPEVIREHGGTPVRTRVGHSFIKAVMAETGAVFGGEHSAHYYFRDNYRADSGLDRRRWSCSSCCARPAQPLSELRKPFERYADSGEINTEVDDPHAVIERVAARLRRTPTRTGSTASPSTSATGGSTCARPTPSRCCASTSKRRPGTSATRTSAEVARTVIRRRR